MAAQCIPFMVKAEARCLFITVSVEKNGDARMDGADGADGAEGADGGTGILGIRTTRRGGTTRSIPMCFGGEKETS